MYCPRCGTPNEPGDRFCSSCGASLRTSEPSSERPQSLRGRIAKIVGETRRGRLLTAGTALALAIAIAAFIALSPADDGTIPRDAYTLAAERICLNAKQQIVGAERRSVEDAKHGRQAELAQSLVPIVATWRAEMGILKTPSDRLEQVNALDAQLRGVEIQIAKLARATDSGDRGQIISQAKRVDAQTRRVETAIKDLGLEECAHETIGLAHPRS